MLIDQEVIIDSNVKGERSVSFELSLDDNKHSENILYSNTLRLELNTKVNILLFLVI